MTSKPSSPGCAEPAVDNVRIRTYDDPAEAAELGESVRALYAEVFAEPPHNEGPTEVDLFTTRWWPRALAEPAFRLVVADLPDQADRAEHHGLLGATYGYQLAPATTWWDGALATIAAETSEWSGRTVAIIEMMVCRSARRRGLATAMHKAFLADRGEERVTLLVLPENDVAAAVYRHWGYHHLGQIQPARTAPIYDAMLATMTELTGP